MHLWQCMRLGRECVMHLYLLFLACRDIALFVAAAHTNLASAPHIHHKVFRHEICPGCSASRDHYSCSFWHPAQLGGLTLPVSRMHVCWTCPLESDGPCLTCRAVVRARSHAPTRRAAARACAALL
eukprot:6208374-Pleurochrysis_carterae.AAC.1